MIIGLILGYLVLLPFCCSGFASIYILSLIFSDAMIFVILMTSKETTFKQEMILEPGQMILCLSIPLIGILLYCFNPMPALRRREYEAHVEWMKRCNWRRDMPKEEAEIIMESILQPIKTFDQAVETLGEIPAIAVKKSKWALVTSFVIYVLSVPLLLPKKLHADCTKAEKLAEMLLKKE